MKEKEISFSELIEKEDKSEYMPLTYQDLSETFNKIPFTTITRHDFLKHLFPIRAKKHASIFPTLDLFIIRCITRFSNDPIFQVINADPEFQSYTVERIRTITRDEMNILSLPKKVWERVINK